MKYILRVMRKWSLGSKVLPIVGLVVVGKVLAHNLGYETIQLNALFTSLVAGTIFLLGFLISGVLSDYKEAEKIPGDVAASLEALYDDGYTIWKAKQLSAAEDFIGHHKALVTSMEDWFYKKQHTQHLLAEVSGMNDFFVNFEKEGVQPNIIIKMKTEQNNLRRMIIRIHTIRDTNFVPSVYAIVEFLAFAVTAGMILVRIEPFYEALFFTILVSYLFSYMILLIHDLDNPFDYSHSGESGTEVSLKPFHDVARRIAQAD